VPLPGGTGTINLMGRDGNFADWAKAEGASTPAKTIAMEQRIVRRLWFIFYPHLLLRPCCFAQANSSSQRKSKVDT